MILSASRRTDLPAFFPEWFMECIRKEYAEVRNPFHSGQLSRIPLNPEQIDCIVFWSKNPAPLFPFLPELDRRGYRYYFQFTLTPYGREIEPGVPDKERLISDFIRLSERIGREKVIWRYDPILFSDVFSVKYHSGSFQRLAERLAPYTERCVISFADFYRKAASALVRCGCLDPEDSIKQEIAGTLRKTGAELGLRLFACAEKLDFRPLGIEPSACIDGELVRRITGRNPTFRRDRNQRAECGCAESRDIGEYRTCRHGCLYCYAK